MENMKTLFIISVISLINVSSVLGAPYQQQLPQLELELKNVRDIHERLQVLENKRDLEVITDLKIITNLAVLTPKQLNRLGWLYRTRQYPSTTINTLVGENIQKNPKLFYQTLNPALHDCLEDNNVTQILSLVFTPTQHISFSFTGNYVSSYLQYNSAWHHFHTASAFQYYWRFFVGIRHFSEEDFSLTVNIYYGKRSTSQNNNQITYVQGTWNVDNHFLSKILEEYFQKKYSRLKIEKTKYIYTFIKWLFEGIFSCMENKRSI